MITRLCAWAAESDTAVWDVGWTEFDISISEVLVIPACRRIAGVLV